MFRRDRFLQEEVGFNNHSAFDSVLALPGREECFIERFSPREQIFAGFNHPAAAYMLFAPLTVLVGQEQKLPAALLLACFLAATTPRKLRAASSEHLSTATHKYFLPTKGLRRSKKHTGTEGI